MITVSYKLNKNNYVELWSNKADSFPNVFELADEAALKHFNDNYLDYKLANGVLVYDVANHGLEKLQAKAQAKAQIAVLKAQLTEMDYKTSKYADGNYTQFEWQTIVAERNGIRAQIGQLEQAAESQI